MVRQTREQQGRDINGYMEPKGNMGNVDNMGYMDNIRDNIGIDNAGNTGMDTLGQIGPQYEMVLLSDNDNEKMMSQYDEKQQKHVLACQENMYTKHTKKLLFLHHKVLSLVSILFVTVES